LFCELSAKTHITVKIIFSNLTSFQIGSSVQNALVANSLPNTNTSLDFDISSSLIKIQFSTVKLLSVAKFDSTQVICHAEL
jgi:hypothetical protein